MKKITQFDFLRVLGMMMVFVCHISFLLPISIPDFGARGVELFVLLSGFLLAYNHFDDVFDISIINNLKFAWRHIKKLYLLHIMTMLLAIILTYFNEGIKISKSFIIKLITNTLLIQSWIPNSDYYFSFNGVTWFLSSILFCYFCFPYLIFVLQKVKDSGFEFLAIFILLVIEIMYEKLFQGFMFFDKTYTFNIFPVSVLYKFFIGNLLSLYYNKQVRESSNRRISGLILILILILYSFSILFINNKFTNGNKFVPGEYIAITSLLIFAFANLNDKSRVYEFITNKVFISLSTISFVFYITHQIFIRGFVVFFNKLNKFVVFPWFIQIFVFFVVSIFFSYIWIKGKRKIEFTK